MARASKADAPVFSLDDCVEQTNAILARFDEPAISPLELRCMELQQLSGYNEEPDASRVAYNIIQRRTPREMIGGLNERDVRELLDTLRMHSASNTQSLAKLADAHAELGRLAKSLADLAEHALPLAQMAMAQQFAKAFGGVPPPMSPSAGGPTL